MVLVSYPRNVQLAAAETVQAMTFICYLSNFKLYFDSMQRPGEILAMMRLAESGTMPPSPREALEAAHAVVGFSFGIHFNGEGGLGDPGPLNDGLADVLINDPLLSEKKIIVLQEEIAESVRRRAPQLAPEIAPSLLDRIITVPTISKPGKTINTKDVMDAAQPIFLDAGVETVISLANKRHMPRSAAVVARRGFGVAIPDVSRAGDFDHNNSQGWIQGPKGWRDRESKTILLFAGLRWI
jgi:hypothetical protein